MPPRKRARLSQVASPDRTSQPKTPTPVVESPRAADEQLLHDPWTDGEEIGLFKGLMRWKPTGIHKHFHLLALHQWMLANGYIHPRNAHTRPAGIWAKLNTLYDLSALDAREDARQLSKLQNPLLIDDVSEDDVDMDADDLSAYSEAANKIDEADFDFPPQAGFEEMVWRQRFAEDEDDESDAELPELNLASTPPTRFTPSFSIEPSEVAASTPRAAPRGRGTAVSFPKIGRGGRGGASGATRRSIRQAESNADSEEQPDRGSDADDVDDEDDADENEDEEEEEEDADSDEEQSHASTPVPRSTRTSRATNPTKVRQQPSRGRGRGRPKR